jgi:hypothetical protein
VVDRRWLYTLSQPCFFVLLNAISGDSLDERYGDITSGASGSGMAK